MLRLSGLCLLTGLNQSVSGREGDVSGRIPKNLLTGSNLQGGGRIDSSATTCECIFGVPGSYRVVARIEMRNTATSTVKPLPSSGANDIAVTMIMKANPSVVSLVGPQRGVWA
jgi:hypothetical protein